MLPTLTLAISTLGVGVERIVLPDPRPEVRFLVVWQDPDGQRRGWMERADVEVVEMEGRGLSRSRNAALLHAKTPYVWLFDDDAQPCVDAALALVERARAEGWAVVTGAVRTPEGAPFKPYPRQEAAWKLRTAPKLSSIETIIDVEAVRARSIRFDEAFGLGARWTMGEEFLFMASVLRAGLRAVYVPSVIAVHPAESTGKDFGRDQVWQASSAALARVFGAWALPVRLAMAWRKRHALGARNMWRYLWIRP